MKVMIISDLSKRENTFKCNWYMDTNYCNKPSLYSRVISSLRTKTLRLQKGNSLRKLIIAGFLGSKTSSCS